MALSNLSIGILVATLTLGACFWHVPTTTAQTAFSIAPRLTVSPSFPQPKSQVTVAIEAPLNSLDGAAIQWKIDGSANSEFANLRSIRLTLKDGGAGTSVEASVSQPGKNPAVYKISIVPSAVDIVIEPNTYVPAGYSGRALPTRNSTFRATAIPHIYENGKRIPASDLIFTWTVNDTVLYGGSVLGKNFISGDIPRFSNGSVSVMVAKRDGLHPARNTTTIRTVSPFVLFYEESTLFGTIFASPDRFVVPKDEVSLKAAPFYLPQSFGDSYDFTWSVDGRTVANESADPSSITLRRTTGTGAASVGFGYSSESGGAMRGAGSVNIQFTDEDFVSL